MIDTKKKPSALEVAKEIAKVYLNRGVIPHPSGDPKDKGTPITSIHVTLQDHSVYLNTDIEAVQSCAFNRNLTLVTVMENGVVVDGSPKGKKSKAE